ncbi:MAG: RHS repeat-associated core domain-containing protein, partial [Candidatus Gracilibacteria bacterium]|nr:RHS repeat-associated core domain-containing protein [Candidatus Gracilibacteria bacterium]
MEKKKILSLILACSLIIQSLSPVLAQSADPHQSQTHFALLHPPEKRIFSFESSQLTDQSYVSLSSGAALFQIPITSPPGLNGLEPNLGLNYNNQAANENGPFGYGWIFPVGQVNRINKEGIQKMYTNPVYSVSIAGIGGEMIQTGTSGGVEEYRLRRESSFAKIEHDTVFNFWKVTTIDGMIYRLGTNEQSRIKNADGSKIYSWQLEQIEDLHGNKVDYEFRRIENNLYPKRISYGASGTGGTHPFEIRFEPFYSSANPIPNRSDRYTSFKTGFDLRYEHLVSSIEIYSQNTKRLSYDFEYTASEIQSRSDLTKVKITGYNSLGSTTEQTIQIDYYNRLGTYTGPLYHRNNLLRTVTYPQGGSITYDYLPSTGYFDEQHIRANPKPYFPLTMVQSVTKTDALGNTNTWIYHYSDGHFYFDSPIERELAGFGRVTVTDPLNQQTKYYFHQGGGFDGSALGENPADDWSLIGMLYRTEQYNSSGTLVQRNISTWKTNSLGPKRSFVYSSDSTSTIFNSSGQGKSTATSSTYDQTNGNILEQIEWGEVTANNNGTFSDIGADDRKSVSQYAQNTTKHLLAFPSSQKLFNHNGTLITESETLYDNLPFGQIDKGDATQNIQKFLEQSRDISTISEYNSNGQVTRVTDALGNRTSVSYDALSLYPASITNALNQTTTFAYDIVYGQPTKTTDPNGLVAETVLDGLGRVVEQKLTDPNQGNQLVTMQSTIYHEPSFPHSVENQVHIDTSTTAKSFSYTDGFGRTVQTRTQTDNGIPNQYIVTNQSYDALGRQKKTSLPVFAAGTIFDFIDGSGIGTLTTYDSLNRPMSITDANGTTSMDYDLWTSIVTDPLGHQKTTKSDAFGQLVQVIEHNAGDQYVTQYQYDIRGLITRLVDAQNNVRNFYYDSLGRMTSQEDLHTNGDTEFGTRSYIYNDNGNVLSQTDAKGQILAYTYDALNRVISEQLQSDPSTLNSYTYDSGTNGIGRLAQIDSPDSVWSAQYDLRGRVTSETQTTDNQQPTTKSYSYTPFDQPSTITHPDGTTLTYTYNGVGQLDSLSTQEGIIVDTLKYNPLSQVTEMRYGNDLVSRFTYDPNQMYRLVRKQTALAGNLTTWQNNIQNSFLAEISEWGSGGKTGLSDDIGYRACDSCFSHSSFGPFAVKRTNETNTETWTLASLVPTALAQLEDEPTLIIDDDAPLNDQSRRRGVNRSNAKTSTNDQRDSTGEIGKPIPSQVVNQAGEPEPLEDKVFFQAKYINTLSNAEPASKYQFRISDEAIPPNTFNSGWQNLNTTLQPEDTSPFIPFDLSTLNSELTTLNWTIAFQTSSGITSPWSDASSFTVKPVPTAPTVTKLQDINYEYDAVGNITRLEETSGTAATKTAHYEYDDLYRLVSTTVTNTLGGQGVPEGDYTENYSYDEVGNIIFKSDFGTYTYDQPGKTNPHAVTKIDDGAGNIREYLYDDSGNMTQEKQTRTNGSSLIKNYAWDHKDRMKEAQVIGANNNVLSTVLFSYDSGVRRLAKSVTNIANTETTSYPFADFEITSEGTSKVSISANNMHLSTVETTPPTTNNPPVPSGVAGQPTTETIFSHSDHLGGSNILTDINAEQVQTIDYFPFGKTRVDESYTGFDETNKFTGHELDDETGLYYAQARYYDPEIGRFVSEDPLGWLPHKLMTYYKTTPQALNQYGYAINNPNKYTDPTGKIIPLILLEGMIMAGIALQMVAIKTVSYWSTIINTSNTIGMTVGGQVNALSKIEDVAVTIDPETSLTEKGFATVDLIGLEGLD